MTLPTLTQPHGTAVAASVGAGVLEALSDGFEGRVESVFSNGFYVRDASSHVFAVLGAGCWPGPLHLLVPDLPSRQGSPVSPAPPAPRELSELPVSSGSPALPARPVSSELPVTTVRSVPSVLSVAQGLLESQVSVGLPVRHDRVSYSDGVLRAGRHAVRVHPCPVWSPCLPAFARLPRPAQVHPCPVWVPCLPVRLNAAVNDWRAIIGDVIDDVNGDRRGIAGGIDPELATVWPAVTAGIRHGDLVTVSRLLAGRGTGLTPSGDDVLAGILLVCAIDRTRRPALSALASSLPTTQLSSSYLRWAALGQSIKPAHDLLDAAAKNAPEQMRHSAHLVAGVGATSGQALLVGMALAATESASVLAATDDAFYNDLTAHRSLKPASEFSLKSN